MLSQIFVPISPFKLVKLFRYLRLVQKKDIETVDKRESYFFHPDYKCYIGGKGRISGTYEGWQEYRDKIILGEISTPGELLTLVTNRNSIGLLTRLHGERQGKLLDLRVFFLFRFSRGKIIEQRSVPYDDEAWDRFWA